MISAKWRVPLRFARVLARLSGVRLDDPYPHVRKFVLVANSRTGSTWVIDLLDSHDHVTAYSELFHGSAYGKPPVGGHRDILMWSSYAASQGSPRTRRDRMRLSFRYLDEEVYRERSGKSAAGFKLMYSQAAFEFYVLAYLKVRRVAVIHLIRQNHLDGILSEDAVQTRHVAHAHSGGEVQPLQLELDPYTLVERLRARADSVRQARELFSTMGLPYAEIYYENLLADASRIHEAIQFLGIDAVPEQLESSLQKVNPTDHRQLIANYDEVQGLLKDTEFFDLLR
jgi:LPS sulfotransferase NodH